MTPEAKTKAKIHAILKGRGAYKVNYIGGAYANNGAPDIMACYRGMFIGIEAKAGKNKPTALQIKNLRDIHLAGGVALVINEANLSQLEDALNDIDEGRSPRSNYHLFAKQTGADEE